MKLALGMGAVALAGFLSGCTSASTVNASTGQASLAGACIDPRDISKQTIVSDQEIRFELRNGDTWTNTMPRACPGLKLSGGFSWEVTGTQVCSNKERIVVKETGTPCLLGEFSKTAAK
jgi:hypothetical protein